MLLRADGDDESAAAAGGAELAGPALDDKAQQRGTEHALRYAYEALNGALADAQRAADAAASGADAPLAPRATRSPRPRRTRAAARRSFESDEAVGALSRSRRASSSARGACSTRSTCTAPRGSRDLSMPTVASVLEQHDCRKFSEILHAARGAGRAGGRRSAMPASKRIAAAAAVSAYVAPSRAPPHGAGETAAPLRGSCRARSKGAGARGGRTGLDGLTILAPVDDAFFGEAALDAFEESSWGVHLIEVPYTISNLVNAAGGTVQPASHDPHHALRFRMDIDGSYMMWCCSDTYPPRRARVIASDIKCESGVLVHIVDKIIYV